MRPVTKTLLMAGAAVLVGLSAAGAAPVRKAGPRPAAARLSGVPAGVQHPTTTTLLSIGEGQMITLPTNVKDVWTSAETVADVYVRSARQIYLFGKAPGEATIYATSADGTVIYSTTARVNQNITSIDRMLKLAMPDSNIAVNTVGQLAVLTGTVGSPADAADAEALVKSALNPGVDMSQPGAMLKMAVISRLKTATPMQVNLQVKIAEVSRNFAKNIGSNLTSLDGTNGFKFGIGSGRGPASTYTTDPALPLGVGTSTFGYTIDPTAITFLPNGQIDPTSIKTVQRPGTTVTPGAQRTTLAGLGKLFGLNILGALDLGETNGQVTTLANPNLTVISGETSSFLAGGEIPIPVSQGLGAVSVEYKQYGVSLTYTATVLSDGRINLRVRPEVSQLSAAGAVTIGGVQIPALTTRRAETTVELGSGQSMVIGGLLSNTHNNSFDKTPGAGDLPILGALFRSNAFQRNESELMIVVTPYLVKPIDANSVVLPTDAYQAPDDASRILLGQLSSGKTGGDRPKPTVAPPATATPVLGATGAAPAIGWADPPGQPAPRPVAAEPKALNPNSRPKQGAPVAMPGFSGN